MFSAGEIDTSGDEPIRYEDPTLGVYKKLAIRNGKLAGTRIRQQIGAGESYAGNAVTYQDRSRRQIEPIEHTRCQEV